MNGLQESLREVLPRYSLRVFHIRPLLTGWEIETDRGRKRLEMWPDKEQLEWSFAWREGVAKNGFRSVERFIRTKEGMPYVWAESRGFALVDHVSGTAPNPTDRNDCRRMGNILAMLHQAMEECPAPATASGVRQVQRMETEIAFMREILKRPESIPHWAARNGRPLLERMQRAHRFLAGMSEGENGTFPASVSAFTPVNMAKGADFWYVHGFRPSCAAPRYQDMAQLLKCVYLESGRDDGAVKAVLAGYAERRPFLLSDVKKLLAYLLYPFRPVQWIRQGFRQNDWSRERLDRGRHLLRQQMAWDSLAVCVARWFEEREKGGSP
ncbi:hypothetical protein BSNK01_25210 [Bacillaceae bacterium]